MVSFIIWRIRLICDGFHFSQFTRLYLLSHALLWNKFSRISPLLWISFLISVILSMLKSNETTSISITIPSYPAPLFLFSLACASSTSDFNISSRSIFRNIAGCTLLQWKCSPIYSFHNWNIFILLITSFHPWILCLLMISMSFAWLGRSGICPIAIWLLP